MLSCKAKVRVIWYVKVIGLKCKILYNNSDKVNHKIRLIQRHVDDKCFDSGN